MPDNPEAPAPAPDPQPPAAPAFDPSALVGAVVEANRRAAFSEARANAADRAANDARSAASRPRGPDPLDRLAAEDLTLAPEQKKALLASAIQDRARAISARDMQAVREENFREREALKAEMALNNVMAMRPELSDPANASNFGAAMTKTKMEADAQGIQMSPAQLAQAAARTYDQIFKRPAERPPFVEGAARPDLSPPLQPDAGPTAQNMLEQTYGIKPGKIRPPYDIKNQEQMNSINNEYTLARNKKLLDRGVVTDISAITQNE